MVSTNRASRLSEYELIFKRAELKPVEVRVDMNSLKARLVHNPAGSSQ